MEETVVVSAVERFLSVIHGMRTGAIPHRVSDHIERPCERLCERVQISEPRIMKLYEGRGKFKGISPMNCGANNRYIPNHPETRTASNMVSKLTRQQRWGELHSLAINMAINAYPTIAGGATTQ